jgi:DNA-binding MurR/RpiR family transcriptional regulator
MPRRGVLVAFDFRRYQKDTIEFARTVHRRGASVVLVTDPWLSPIAEIAAYTFPAAVEAVSPFDSLMPAFALADLLVTAVIESIGDQAERRERRWKNSQNLATYSALRSQRVKPVLPNRPNDAEMSAFATDNSESQRACQ